MLYTLTTARGSGLQGHSLMQDISPLIESDGVAEWQTSRTPMADSCPLFASQGRDGGTIMVSPIARRIMHAFHRMVPTIGISAILVNVKL